MTARRTSLDFLTGLAGKQAAVTLLIALSFGILGSATELFLDWRAKRQETVNNMQLMLQMAQPSATEAAYLLNEQLAGSVVHGLARHAAVKQASLRDESGTLLAHQRNDRTSSSPNALAERLFGDITDYHITLTQQDKPIGRLDLTLSADVLAEDFNRRMLTQAAIGLLRALAICAVVVLVFWWMIIRPLTQLSQLVAAIDPARPGATPIPPSPGHARDEIGVLIATFNRLLSAFQQGLDQRDRAEAELTALTLELEQRVEQRTAALAAAKQEIEALNRQLTAENLRMGAELEVSRKLQRMTLPTPDELNDIPGLDVATFMESAHEVGGDYYDILRDQTQNGRLRIGIGDVTGHGLESGVVMLMTQSAVRTLTTGAIGDLAKTLQVLNRTIYDNIKRMGSDKNLTLALIDYQPRADGGVLRISGQHESVIVVRRDGRLELVDTTLLGMPLGLLDEVGTYLGETEVRLSPGDVVALYTDGITEAANRDHQLYGLPRLCQVIVDHRMDDAETIKHAVIADVKRHIGDQVIYDDLTLIILKQKEIAP